MFKLSRRTAVAAATCLFALSGVVSAAELTGTLKKVQETGSITLGYRESSVPFSYLNADGKPVGYAFTVCQRVADAVKSELGLKTLDVKYQAVTSANRIPLIQNGTVDIECGSTTNSLKRQREAAFSVSYFGIQVSAAVWKSSGIKSLEDLNGKTVTVPSRTLMLTSFMSIVVIFLLLYTQFKNAAQSGVILLNLPLALIGGGLHVTNEE